MKYISPPSHYVYTALPAILPATNIFFSVFKIAYRDVLQNGHQDLRSDIDVTELAEKQEQKLWLSKVWIVLVAQTYF